MNSRSCDSLTLPCCIYAAGDRQWDPSAPSGLSEAEPHAETGTGHRSLLPLPPRHAQCLSTHLQAVRFIALWLLLTEFPHFSSPEPVLQFRGQQCALSSQPTDEPGAICAERFACKARLPSVCTFSNETARCRNNQREMFLSSSLVPSAPRPPECELVS